MGPSVGSRARSPRPQTRDSSVRSGKCMSVCVDSLRVGLSLCSLLVLPVLLCSSPVAAGPVILNLSYLQGPVPVARNIRHLPCVSRRTNEEGLCMFAIDCLKANGTHLGTCIDRFYFGSCCQISDKDILPHIVGNNIEDNSIENANFVHPRPADKYENHVNKITETNKNKFGIKKPITSTTQTAETLEPRTDAPSAQNQKDDVKTVPGVQTTINNAISNDNVKLTTGIPSTTTQSPKIDTSKVQVTEMPIKLSTFQSVSGGSNLIYDKAESLKPIDITESPKVTTSQSSDESSNSVSHKPYKPTYKPRPGYRPINYTRPQYANTKPRPTKPIIITSTRKPGYRVPTKRPLTKKPLPVPPRLNITILPQSTSTRPAITKPSVSTTVLVNITTVKEEIKPTTTTTSTTTTTQATTTTTSTTTTTTPAPTTTTVVPSTTEIPTTITTVPTIVTVAELSTAEIMKTTTDAVKDVTEMVTESLSPSTTIEITTVNDEVTTEQVTKLPEEPQTESYKEEIDNVTLEISTTEQATVQTEAPKPIDEVPVTSPKPSTEYPPLVTWSNPVESASKVPELGPPNDESWAPVTPPEGWVLISTISPKPETTPKITTSKISTSTTTPIDIPNTTSKTESPTTFTLEFLTEAPQTTKTTEKSELQESNATTPSSSPIPSSSPVTQAPLLEFTVNVTLSPTVPTSTSSLQLLQGLTSPTSIQPEPTTNNTDSVTTVDTTTPSITTIKTTTESYDITNYKSVCGRRLWPQSRIVGGAKSGFGQWPWQISLRQYRTSNYLHKCGAALLNENWAITAAHCVDRVPPSELLVRLGEYDLASEEEPYGFTERRVQIIASHPHFDPSTFEYDLALLRFYEPVSFQPNILPICVPDNDDDYVGRTAYVTGWGRLYDEGPLPSVLQEVQVPVINNSACEAMYQTAGYNEHIPNIFICAGYRKGGSDSCEGDSGGPMVIERERDSRFVLSGVISWGIGCAEPNQPGVYTRISEFREWINQILQF